MTSGDDIKTFEDSCQEHGIWALKYCSDVFGGPIYLIWYNETDGSGLDKLLTFRSGEIFAVNQLADIGQKIPLLSDELTPFENLQDWLDQVAKLVPVEGATYEIEAIRHSIDANNLDIESLGQLTNFINLLDDYIRQDERNSGLQAWRDNEYLVAAWDYYYQYIFWPRFNDPVKFETWERPVLEMDFGNLLHAFEQTRLAFEKNIRLA